MSLIENEIFTKEKYELDLLNSYSRSYSNIYLSCMIDDLIKYDKKNDYLMTYYKNLSIPYMVYDNKFKGIDNERFLSFLERKIR